jgi:hypothetical protein
MVGMNSNQLIITLLVGLAAAISSSGQFHFDEGCSTGRLTELHGCLYARVCSNSTKPEAREWIPKLTDCTVNAAKTCRITLLTFDHKTICAWKGERSTDVVKPTVNATTKTKAPQAGLAGVATDLAEFEEPIQRSSRRWSRHVEQGCSSHLCALLHRDDALALRLIN